MESSSRSLHQSSLESRSEDEPEALSQESVGTGSSSRQEPGSGSSSAQTNPSRVAAIQSDRFDYAFRCCMLGDAQSGKRALAHSLVYGKYSKQAALQDSVLDQMCGTNWTTMTMAIVNIVTRIQLFDNTASAAYSSSAFHGIDIVLVTFDMEDRNSYQVALNWLQVLFFYEYGGTAMLVANRWEKSLAGRRNVTQAEAKLASHKYGALYVETSPMPELQHSVLTALEIGVRFALFALTKRESYVAHEVTGCIDVGHVSGAVKAKLMAALLSEDSGHTDDSSHGDGRKQSAAAGSSGGLFGRAARRPPLFAAIESRDVAKVSSLLSSSGVAARMRDPSSKATPLMTCAAQCESAADVEIAAMLLKQCSAEDLNLQSGSGETALMMALRAAPGRESSALVRLLLLAPGTNAAVINNAGSNAFHLACEKGHMSVLQELPALPEAAFAVNASGESPFYIACRQGNATLVGMFLRDARVGARVHFTPLQYSVVHVVVLNANVACLKLLLECPALRGCVNALNKEQYSPLYLALELENEECKMLLLGHGADPRVGRPHRLAPQLIRGPFVPTHLAWCKTQEHLTAVNLSRCQLAAVPLQLTQLKATLQRLDLSCNALEVVPRQILELSELQELLLNDNSLRSGVTLEMVALSKLRVLRLDGNARLPADLGPFLLCKIAQAPSVDLSCLHLEQLSVEMVQACTQLEVVALNGNALTAATVSQLGVLTSLKSLWMHDNQIEELPSIGWEQLELLKLSGNKIKALPAATVSKKLRELWVEKNLLTTLHVASIAPSLRRLWLDGNQIASIATDGGGGGGEALALDCLSMKNNVLHEVPQVFLTTLTRLWLDGNLITHLPASFVSMSNLATLSLSENPLRVFPVQISYLKQLVELSLNDCVLEQVDPSIGNLMALRKLSLRNNRLRFLPQTIGLMTGLTMLDVAGNVDLTSPPPDTVRRGTAAVVGFLHDLIADSKPSYRMKLMIVGQEAVGKTSLLRAVTAKSKKKTGVFGAKRTVRNLSTDGIDIEQWDRKVKLVSGETVKINFRAWDFAGQEVYYSTHAFFLSNRSVYLVVWSLTASEDTQRVLYWLQSIQSRAPKAPVMLVGTHADMPGANLSEEYGRQVVEKYRARFPELNIVSFTPFSVNNAGMLKTLLESLDSTTVRQPFIGEPLPTVYLTLEAAVIAERKRVPPVMSWEEFQKLGVSCGLLREDELLRAVALLHEMGSLFFYKPTDKSAVARMTMVVLDPQWLTKVMAQVITTKKSFVRNAVLEHKEIGFMWKAPEYPTHLHGPLLSLLQSFDVCYRMDGGSDPHVGRSLVPVLLPFRTGEEVLRSSRVVEYAVQIGRIFEFEFLPAGFFGRFTVRMLHLAKQEELWADHIVVTLKDAKARVSLAGMTVNVMVQSQAYDESLLLLLKTTVQSLEALAEEWFQIRASTRVPCVHCLKQNASKPPHLFDLQECEQAAGDGLSYVSCCGQFPVALAALCPDVIVSSDLPVVKWESLENQVRIGEGTFAYVFRAGYRDTVVAIKRLINETDFRELRKEAASLMSLKHRNVVELLGVCYKPPALVTEFLEKGSLFEYLADAEKVPEIPWPLRLRFARDIAAGMLFLHTTTPPVLHRDLKSANVLLSASLVCKISDFGTVTIVAPFTTGRAVTNPRWQAPEVLQNLSYGAPSDVYAFGILLWELCTREVPFTDKPSYAWAHNVEDDVIRGHRPPVRLRFPPLFAELMTACWAQEPEQRPTFAKVVKELQREESFDDLDASMDLRQAGLSPRRLFPGK